MIHVKQAVKKIDGISILQSIDFQVNQGEIFGIIGPNGSGKSTLVKLLSGIDTLTSGAIELDGKPIAHYTRKELATWVAVLPQNTLPSIGFTVREVVEMGRYPFQNWLGRESGSSTQRIDRILHQLHLEKLQDRTLDQLSGGERQRTALAKVMAQEPRLLLLDEPTTYLDIGTQMELMDIVRSWRDREQLTVVVVLHDLNIAALYCDRLLLLHEGKQIALGSAHEIMSQQRIEQVYAVRPIVVPHPVEHVPQLLMQPNHYHSKGS